MNCPTLGPLNQSFDLATSQLWNPALNSAMMPRMLSSAPGTQAAAGAQPARNAGIAAISTSPSSRNLPPVLPVNST